MSLSNAASCFSFFSWCCFCLIKSYQSIQSIYQNLFQFNCVLHTRFSAWDNGKDERDSHCFQGIESLCGSNGMAVGESSWAGLHWEQLGFWQGRGVRAGVFSAFMEGWDWAWPERLVGIGEVQGREECIPGECVCIGWESARSWDSGWCKLGTMRVH